MQKGDADDAHSIDVAPRALAGQHAGSDEHAEAKGHRRHADVRGARNGDERHR